MGSYYLLDAGVRQCPEGSAVLDKTECEEACETLNIPISGRFKNGKPCYRAGSGVCKQNGGFTRRSSRICKKEGISKIDAYIFSGISKKCWYFYSKTYGLMCDIFTFQILV